MRSVTLILVVLLLLLQYPLWLGKGSWLKVWDLHRQVEAQQQVNQQTRERNAVLFRGYFPVIDGGQDDDDDDLPF